MKTPSVGSKSGYENHVNAQYKKPLAIVTALALLALGVIAIGLLGHFNVIDLGSRSSKLLIVAGGSALLVSVIALCLLQCKKSSDIQKGSTNPDGKPIKDDPSKGDAGGTGASQDFDPSEGDPEVPDNSATQVQALQINVLGEELGALDEQVARKQTVDDRPNSRFTQSAEEMESDRIERVLRRSGAKSLQKQASSTQAAQS